MLEGRGDGPKFGIRMTDYDSKDIKVTYGTNVYLSIHILHSWTLFDIKGQGDEWRINIHVYKILDKYTIKTYSWVIINLLNIFLPYIIKMAKTFAYRYEPS